MERGTSTLAASLLLVPLVVALAGVAAAVRGWFAPKRRDHQARTVSLLSGAWLAAYVPFFIWWEPANPEFWIAPWIPAAILMALGLRRLPARTARIAAVTTLGAVFVVNLLGSVLPQHDASDDYWRHCADWYEREGRPGDLVIADGYIWISYLRYFAHEQVLDGAKLRALPR